MCSLYVILPVDFGNILVGLDRVADQGIDGGLLVVREDGWDRSRCAQPVVHVGIHFPGLQLKAWQIVPG